jgi:hypothetical protein
MLQWFEPFFIATLGSPDILSVISNKHNLDEKFAVGSMCSAMSRCAGVGTYRRSTAKGMILTYPVEEFRKLLKFSKNEKICWRDQVEAELSYDLLSDLGLDFNREKLYQSGFEFRSLDEFPANYLPELLHAIFLICEHSRQIEDVAWASDSVVWNNLVFRVLKEGFRAAIDKVEKQVLLELLQLNDRTSGHFESTQRLDAFFFVVLQELHIRYKTGNVYHNALMGQKTIAPPRCENFNEHQTEQYLVQLDEV